MGDKNLSHLMANGNYYFPEGGHFVSQKQVRIHQILQDYDPNLELQWIPPDRRSAADVAFRVLCRPPGRAPYVVVTASEADERLLARVFESDQRRAAQRLGKNENLLNFIDNYNNALELMKAKEREEARKEDHEIAARAFANEKSRFRHKVNGRVIDFERSSDSQSSKTIIWR
jgi:hypothetical protein